MKIILLVITILCAVRSQSQIRIGVQGGYNHARLSPNESSSDIYSYTTRGFRGFQIGAVAEISIAENWVFRPGMFVNGKGTRLEKAGFEDKSTRFIELHYLEVPMVVEHKWDLGKNFVALAGAGMYIARAFRGVEKGEGTSLSGSYYINNSVEFSSNNKENDGHPTIINPFDYGLNFLAGIQRQSIQLLVGYGYGLQRVFPKSLVFENKFTNKVFSLSAVYFFKNKR